MIEGYPKEIPLLMLESTNVLLSTVNFLEKPTSPTSVSLDVILRRDRRFISVVEIIQSIMRLGVEIYNWSPWGISVKIAEFMIDTDSINTVTNYNV